MRTRSFGCSGCKKISEADRGCSGCKQISEADRGCSGCKQISEADRGCSGCKQISETDRGCSGCKQISEADRPRHFPSGYTANVAAEERFSFFENLIPNIIKSGTLL